jgi:uncharacterized protein YvpB
MPSNLARHLVPLALLVGLLLPARPLAWAATVEPPPPAPPNWWQAELPPYALPLSEIPLALTPPNSALIQDFVGHPQRLALSCESRSAADWANFFGVAVDEREFFYALPVSDDPDVGFVGSVNGVWGQLPPRAYGVHAGPVVRLLQKFGVPATFQINTPWTSVQNEVAAGRPVIVWVTGHVEPGKGVFYTARSDGHQTVVARYEHTVILLGYEPDKVRVEDEGHEYLRPLSVFLESWGALRNMAIMAAPLTGK